MSLSLATSAKRALRSASQRSSQRFGQRFAHCFTASQAACTDAIDALFYKRAAPRKATHISMARVLAEAPAPPAPARPWPPQPRVFEALPIQHEIDAAVAQALRQKLSLDAKRKSAVDRREALVMRALEAVTRREEASDERNRQLDARAEALDRRERLLREREDREARNAQRLEAAMHPEPIAVVDADPRLLGLARRLEAVERLVDETAVALSPKQDEPAWRQRASRRAATEKTYETRESRRHQVEAYLKKGAARLAEGERLQREPPRPRTAPIPKIDVRLPRPREEEAPAKAEDGRRRGRQAREPPQLDDMAVAREICRSLDVLSRETGESRETWRTKIFGATPPPKGARQ